MFAYSPVSLKNALVSVASVAYDVAKFSVKIPIEVKKANPDPTEAEPPAITVENKFTDVNTTTGNWYYNDVLLADVDNVVLVAACHDLLHDLVGRNAGCALNLNNENDSVLVVGEVELIRLYVNVAG